ncbi:MAG: AraC family transcriptional regulator [Clostridia bacterium]|nr:AraC family transcriptional regulator [Clostridia bacterium]
MYDNLKYIHGGKFISRGEWKHQSRKIDTTEIIMVTKGVVHMAIGGRKYTAHPGDILKIDPDVLHVGTEISTETVNFYWLHFVGIRPDELPNVCFRPENVQQAELLIRQILHYENTEGYPKECCDELFKVLLTELNFVSTDKDTKSGKLFSEIKEWVRINSDLPLKVSDVAEHFKYNVDYINRAFKKHYPDGLKAYIDKMRMQKIKQDLMDESLSLKEISAKYHFEEYKYFLKYFKYHEGISPGEYRSIYYNIHTNNA